MLSSPSSFFLPHNTFQSLLPLSCRGDRLCSGTARVPARFSRFLGVVRRGTHRWCSGRAFTHHCYCRRLLFPSSLLYGWAAAVKSCAFLPRLRLLPAYRRRCGTRAFDRCWRGLLASGRAYPLYRVRACYFSRFCASVLLRLLVRDAALLRRSCETRARMGMGHVSACLLPPSASVNNCSSLLQASYLSLPACLLCLSTYHCMAMPHHSSLFLCWACGGTSAGRLRSRAADIRLALGFILRSFLNRLYRSTALHLPPPPPHPPAVHAGLGGSSTPHRPCTPARYADLVGGAFVPCFALWEDGAARDFCGCDIPPARVRERAAFLAAGFLCAVLRTTAPCPGRLAPLRGRKGWAYFAWLRLAGAAISPAAFTLSRRLRPFRTGILRRFRYFAAWRAVRLLGARRVLRAERRAGLLRAG